MKYLAARPPVALREICAAKLKIPRIYNRSSLPRTSRSTCRFGYITTVISCAFCREKSTSDFELPPTFKERPPARAMPHIRGE